jgi:hypothetical protein
MSSGRWTCRHTRSMSGVESMKSVLAIAVVMP